jgi:hypothetical protein
MSDGSVNCPAGEEVAIPAAGAGFTTDLDVSLENAQRKRKSRTAQMMPEYGEMRDIFIR